MNKYEALAAKQPESTQPSKYESLATQQQNQGAVGQPPRQPKETLLESVTGSKRMTPQLEQVPELQESGILSTEDQALVARIAPVLLTTTDPNEIYGIIKKNFPNIQAQFEKDAAGNVFPLLYNPKTQSYAAINKPGLTGLDVLQGLGLGAAFAAPAATGKLNTISRAALGEGAMSAAVEAWQKAEGGTFDKFNVFLDTLFGGGGKAAEDMFGAYMRQRKANQDTPPLTPEQKAAEYAKEKGVPLLTSDVVPSDTKIGKFAEIGGDIVPITGTGRQRAAQTEARTNLVEEFTEGRIDYSPNVVRQSLIDSGDQRKRAAGDRLNIIRSAVGDVEIQNSQAVRQIDEEIWKLTHNPNGTPKSSVDQATVDALTKYKEDLIADPSFNALRESRTSFRENVRGDRQVMPATAQQAIDRVYQSMTSDLDRTVKNELGDRQLARYKQADTIFFNEANNLKKTRLKTILEKGDVKPELIDQMLFDKNPSQVRLLYKSLNDEGKKAARAGILARAMEKSGGVPSRFLNELNKLEKQTGIFFRGEDRKALNGLKNYLEFTRKAPEAGVVTKTGQQNAVWGIPAAAYADFKSTGGLGTLGALTYGAARSIYESPAVRDLLLKIGSVPADSIESVKLIEKLRPLIQGQVQATQKKLMQESEAPAPDEMPRQRGAR